MLTILRRLWPRRRAADRITMGVHVVAVPKPIPLAEREPEPGEMDGGLVWAGFKAPGLPYWEWCIDDIYTSCSTGYTHWLPASVEVLPTRCCVPEVG